MKNTKKSNNESNNEQKKELQSKIKHEAEINKENFLNKQTKNQIGSSAAASKNHNANLKKEKEKKIVAENLNSNSNIEDKEEKEEKPSVSLNSLNQGELKNIPDVKLHKVVLENFKSFDGKHEVGYFQNFSVVMGPNGSGKSNIIDAICFAFGMNTVSLRSTNLKELIFTMQPQQPVQSQSKMLLIY